MALERDDVRPVQLFTPLVPAKAGIQMTKLRLRHLNPR